MRIRQEIEELRGDHAPQLRAQSSMLASRARWSETSQARDMLEEMKAFGAGADLADCACLRGLVRDADLALQLIGSLNDELLLSLATEPLGQMPFRHNVGAAGASLILASSGRAQLLLTERAPTRAAAETAVFNAIERHDCILSGHAQAKIAEYQNNGSPPKLTEQGLARGIAFSSIPDQQRRALLIENVQQSLLTLRLVRHPLPDTAKPSIEVSLKDGLVVHRAAATIGESRQELALSLLGAMGRTDAASIAAEMAQEGPDHLRWQALRQAITMETATGFAALSAMAARLDDPLSKPAESLREQLIAAHPVLAQLECEKKERELCPA